MSVHENNGDPCVAKETVERVSAVHTRFYMTIPQPIREELGISERTSAYVWPNKDFLIISLLPPPSKKTDFREIRISGKGLFVIPKSLRMARGIEVGTNLVFSFTSKREIYVEMLKSAGNSARNFEQERLQTIREIFDMLGQLDLEKVGTNKDYLTIECRDQIDKKLPLDFILELENTANCRLIIERTENKKKIRILPTAIRLF
ncbi:MAG: hypothetical protein ACFFD4_30815 [Candidatus Odinarchaeota archaeon]